MRRKYLLAALCAVVLVVAGYFIWAAREPSSASGEVNNRIVINEAARTLVYLPLYHAQRMRYFEQEGVQVEIVTGGTATNSVAALIAGDADIAQADPMYAAISQSAGSDIVVVGQIVGRIGLWAVARPNTNRSFDAAGLRGRRVITHPRPMTAYTYTILLLKQLGLRDRDVDVIQTKAGTELAAYRAERNADFVVGVEPAISILETQGARVVYSWPTTLGDRTFSGLMVRRTTLSNRGEQISAALRAYQRALDDIGRLDPEVMRTARIYFQNVEPAVLQRALSRLVLDRVFPQSLVISPESWNSAVRARQEVGDIRGPAPYQRNVAAEFTQQALVR
jgi:NitT/TauT family transport system substrate-binding protein